MSKQAAGDLTRVDLRSLWKNASWTSASLAVTTVLAFAETILLVRFLGAAVLGVFVLIRAYPEAVQQVLDCRTRETVVRYLGEFVALDQRERASAVLRLIWVVDVTAGLIAMAIVLATVSLAARYVVHDTAMVWLMAVYAISQFVGTLDSASGSVLRVFDRFRVATTMGACGSVARFAAILVVLVLGGRIAPLIYALVAVEVAYTAASTWVSVSLLRTAIGFRVWGNIGAIRDRRKEILRFLLHTNVAGTLKMSSDKLVLIIIGVLGGTTVTAYYKVASQVGTSIMLFSDPFYMVIYPSISKMAARREWRDMFAGLKRLLRITLLVAIPAAVLASGLMIVLIPAVFGVDFDAAIIPAIIIMWGVLPEVVFFWLTALLACLNETGRLVKYRAVSSGLQLALALALIRYTGVLGAAASLLVMLWLNAALKIRLGQSWRRRLQDQVLQGDSASI